MPVNFEVICTKGNTVLKVENKLNNIRPTEELGDKSLDKCPTAKGH